MDTPPQSPTDVVTPAVEAFVTKHECPRKTAVEALGARVGAHAAGDGSPYFVVDLGTVHRQFNKWTTLLPRVEPFYAVKCNNDKMVLESLKALGTGFDCASAGEIAQMTELGLAPERIIYANPCKQTSHIAYAKKVGVKMMTFDCKDELAKIKAIYPEAELVIRVLVDDSYSVCKLGTKYGCPPKEAADLLEHAKTLQLNVIGVSFHVGSGCQNALAYTTAVSIASDVFGYAEDLGFNFQLLDIGGGFPGTDNPAQAPVTFDEIAPVLNAALDEKFPFRTGVRIIAEPGRYMVCASHTEACPVISRRVMMDEAPANGGPPEEVMSYYINDGVYGSFNCTLYDHVEVFPQILKSAVVGKAEAGAEGQNTLVSTVWGPTCDSMDKVVDRVNLPKLEVGDWLYFEDMGAYTCCASSTFNGFERPDKHYIYSATSEADLASIPAGFPVSLPTL